MISAERVEAAIHFLVDTDSDVAYAEGEVMRLERKIERIKDNLYLSEDGTVPERKAKANRHPEVAVLEDEYVDALVKFKALKAKRDTARVEIEVWRSFESSRRAGV
jgi:hypothetical protein